MAAALDFHATQTLFPPSHFGDKEGPMANKKAENSNKTQLDPSESMSESSPNPHGESKVLQMPINTDQRNATGGRNVPQVPNTVGGKLNPSVAHEFQGRVLSKEGKEIQDGEAKRTHAPRREKTVAVFGSKKKDV
jgi:hypothetical protein